MVENRCCYENNKEKGCREGEWKSFHFASRKVDGYCDFDTIFRCHQHEGWVGRPIRFIEVAKDIEIVKR